MKRLALVLIAAALAASRAEACEFDGLAHGYGPASAMFAGVPSYEALNGLVDGTDDALGIVALEPPPAKPPSTRSFARWLVAPSQRSGGPPGAAPEQQHRDQREAAQRPPGGGSVP